MPCLSRSKHHATYTGGGCLDLIKLYVCLLYANVCQKFAARLARITATHFASVIGARKWRSRARHTKTALTPGPLIPTATQRFTSPHCTATIYATIYHSASQRRTVRLLYMQLYMQLYIAALYGNYICNFISPHCTATVAHDIFNFSPTFPFI